MSDSRPLGNDDLSIRVFAQDEWRIYRDLRLRSLADVPEAFGGTLAREKGLHDKAWIARLEQADRRWNCPLLAEFGPFQVGLAWGKIEPDRPKRSDLYQMWVDPAARQRGVGRGLLEKVIAWATKREARYLALSVTCGESAANRLYAGAGFVPVGDPELLRTDSKLLCQEMRRSLGEGHDYCGP